MQSDGGRRQEKGTVPQVLWDNTCDKSKGAVLSSPFKEGLAIQLQKIWLAHSLQYQQLLGTLNLQMAALPDSACLWWLHISEVWKPSYFNLAWTILTWEFCDVWAMFCLPAFQLNIFLYLKEHNQQPNCHNRQWNLFSKRLSSSATVRQKTKFRN